MRDYSEYSQMIQTTGAISMILFMILNLFFFNSVVFREHLIFSFNKDSKIHTYIIIHIHHRPSFGNSGYIESVSREVVYNWFIIRVLLFWRLICLHRNFKR